MRLLTLIQASILAFASGAYAAAYVGCIPNSALNSAYTYTLARSGLPEESGPGCAAACNTRHPEASYALWRASVRACRCYVTGPENPDFADPSIWNPAVNLQGGCASADSQLWYTNTAWQNDVASKCYSVYRDVQPNNEMITTPYLSDCFDRCKTFRAVILSPTAAGGFRCQCQGGLDLQIESNCQREEYFVYGRTAGAAASGVRRKREINVQRAQDAEYRKRHAFCPPGFTACNIGHGVDSYECIDTAEELGWLTSAESCGGCINGAFGASSNNATGVDCSRLHGVSLGGTSCANGQCQLYNCKRGFVLQDGNCVRR